MWCHAILVHDSYTAGPMLHHTTFVNVIAQVAPCTIPVSDLGKDSNPEDSGLATALSSARS